MYHVTHLKISSSVWFDLIRSMFLKLSNYFSFTWNWISSRSYLMRRHFPCWFKVAYMISLETITCSWINFIKKNISREDAEILFPPTNVAFKFFLVSNTMTTCMVKSQVQVDWCIVGTNMSGSWHDPTTCVHGRHFSNIYYVIADQYRISCISHLNGGYRAFNLFNKKRINNRSHSSQMLLVCRVYKYSSLKR